MSYHVGGLMLDHRYHAGGLIPDRAYHAGGLMSPVGALAHDVA